MPIKDEVLKQTTALLETYYWKYNRIGTDDDLLREYAVPTDVSAALSEEEIVRYLISNGVPVDGTITLTPRQVRWIDELCAASDPRSLTVKLKDFGLTLRTHNAWLKNPLFSATLSNRLEKILPDERVRVHQALAREASGGNISAVKLYLTLTGELNEGDTSGKPEVAKLMQGVLEILEYHVPHATLRLLAEDFDQLLTTGRVPTRSRREPVVRRNVAEVVMELDQ